MVVTFFMSKEGKNMYFLSLIDSDISIVNNFISNIYTHDLTWIRDADRTRASESKIKTSASAEMQMNSL